MLNIDSLIPFRLRIFFLYTGIIVAFNDFFSFLLVNYNYVILFINLFACSSLTGRGYTGPTTLVNHPVARGLPNMLQRSVYMCIINMYTVS